jgi:hypothetical protein
MDRIGRKKPENLFIGLITREDYILSLLFIL